MVHKKGNINLSITIFDPEKIYPHSKEEYKLKYNEMASFSSLAKIKTVDDTLSWQRCVEKNFILPIGVLCDVQFGHIY